MKGKKAGWIVGMLLCIGTASAKEKQKPFTYFPLTDEDVHLAISSGTRAKGKACGLSLKDSFQSFSNGMAAMGGNRTGSTGFSVDLYTPFSWVRQNAPWEAKKYRELALEDVSPRR